MIVRAWLTKALEIDAAREIVDVMSSRFTEALSGSEIRTEMNLRSIGFQPSHYKEYVIYSALSQLLLSRCIEVLE